MIAHFFVLSPRGDTILAKQFRSIHTADPGGAHDRSHTEALFRKIKFYDQGGDCPPVIRMPDGHSYFHYKQNGLIFGASTLRNVSPNTVLEVCSVVV